jgi:hypothetical protein
MRFTSADAVDAAVSSVSTMATIFISPSSAGAG